MQSTTKKMASASSSDAVRQQIRSILISHLSTYFSATLNTCPDIVNIYMSLMYYESGFNNESWGPTTRGLDYVLSSPIQNIFNSGSETQRSNAAWGVRAMGLTQTMGWNVVRGASKAGGGKCLIESTRPDLAGLLCINPGDNLDSKFIGPDNISNNILAGLTVLESKWKAIKPDGVNFKIKGPSGWISFTSKIQAALAGYLGLSTSGDANKTTYPVYVSAILSGRNYQLANGETSPKISVAVNRPIGIVTALGPITKGNSTGIRPTGCISSDQSST